MLSQLAVPSLLLFLMLVVPGFLLLRSLGLPRAWSLCAAPIVSIGAISVVGELYAALSVPATPATGLFPLLLVPCTILIAQMLFGKAVRGVGEPFASRVDRRRAGLRAIGGAVDLPTIPAWEPVLFVIVGLLVCNSVFVSEIDAPDVVFQKYDVMHHLNCIRAFYDARRISSLGVGAFLTAQDAAIMPYGIYSFYPSAWYALCALLMRLAGVSVPVAINASLVVFTGIVLPLGMLCWSTLVFWGRSGIVLPVAMTGVSFVCFPWCMAMFGPLYPNLAGFTSLPATMALFMLALLPLEGGEEGARKERLGSVLTRRASLFFPFLIASFGQALLHPNTLFSIFLMLAPYCTWRIYEGCVSSGRHGRVASLGIASAFVLCCMAVWLLCYRSPALRPITSEYWGNFAYVWQEVINILTQTYTLGFFVEMSAQVLLGTLVAVGFVCCLYDPPTRWLAASYLIVCGVNLVAASSPSVTLKQLVAGFWYTDAMRTSAMACLLAALISARGFVWVYEMACLCTDSYNARLGRDAHPRLVAVVLAALFLILSFMPGFNWPGAHSSITPAQFDELKRSGQEYSTMTFKTTFGDYRQLVRDAYDTNVPMDEQEREFLQEVALIVPEGALVINNPMDGSFLAYGGMGIRTYYREFGYENGPTETPESVLVRTSLCNISSDPDVRQAVNELGAEYVLVMNTQNSEASFINLRGDYVPSAFEGITSITSETPGFSEVLVSGPCALYKID